MSASVHQLRKRPSASNSAPWSSKLWLISWPITAPVLPKLSAAGPFGSNSGGCRMPAGKLSAFMAGRFTAFTVCGDMHPFGAIDGLAELGQAARQLEALGAIRVAVGVAAHDAQRRVIDPAVRIADADLERGELGVRLGAGFRRHPRQAVDPLREGLEQGVHERRDLRLGLAAESSARHRACRPRRRARRWSRSRRASSAD